MTNQNNQNNQYKPLAEFFESIGQYKLAALFYQISENSVDSDLFKQAFGHQNNLDDSLGITINRRQTSGEEVKQKAGSFFNFITRVIIRTFDLIGCLILCVPLVLVWILKLSITRWVKWCLLAVLGCLLVLGLSFYGIIFLGQNSQVQIPRTLLDKATNNAQFLPTIEDIKSIESETDTTNILDLKVKKDIINLAKVQAICMSDKLCLDPNLLSWKEDEIKSFKRSGRKKWVEQFYKYEREKNRKADGIIKKDERVWQDLRIDTQTRFQNINNIFAEAKKSFNSPTRSSITIMINKLSNTPTSVIQRDNFGKNLQNVLGLGKEANYTATIEQGINEPSRELWIKAIYLFQLKQEIKDFEKQEGIVKEDSDTYNKLKDMIQQNIDEIPQDKLKKALAEFPKTIAGLKFVEDEILKSLAKDSKILQQLREHYYYNENIKINAENIKGLLPDRTILKQMQAVLEQPSLVDPSYLTSSPFDDVYKIEWIKAIFNYQKDKLDFSDPKGFIDLETSKQTVNPLIMEVTEKVKERILEGL